MGTLLLELQRVNETLVYGNEATLTPVKGIQYIYSFAVS